MLLSFKVSNFRSIGETANLSMTATSDSKFEDELSVYGKFRILPSAVIYGANGSGKSNLYNAMQFVKDLVSDSAARPVQDPIEQQAHILKGESMPTSFEIQFVTGSKKRYAYGFSVQDRKVVSEYLFHFPNKKQAMVFRRTGDSIEFPKGGSFREGLFEQAKLILKSNRLFLSCAAQSSPVPEIEEVFNYFYHDWIFFKDGGQKNLNQSLELMEKDPMLRSQFIRLLNYFGVPALNYEAVIRKIPSDGFEMAMSILRGDNPPKVTTYTTYIVTLVYKQFSIDLNQESTGIQKMFELLCPVINALKNGKLLVMDEFENGLHEFLVFELVKLFNTYSNQYGGQIILITHDTSLLTGELFRRDQVWFTEMISEARVTDLYSLADLRGIRSDEVFRTNYINGKYGAIPFLNPSGIRDRSNYES